MRVVLHAPRPRRCVTAHCDVDTLLAPHTHTHTHLLSLSPPPPPLRYATSDEALGFSPRHRAERIAAEERLAACKRGWDLVWRPQMTPARAASERDAVAAAAARAVARSAESLYT